MDFRFDARDADSKPGLRRSAGNPQFLTPVFFDIDCLKRYFYSNVYTCLFFSETYGIIRAPEFNIAFGINKNSRVIMWFGDLNNLPPYELEYLKPYNVESDHEIDSEFYDAQIDIIYTKPIKEVAILHKMAGINNSSVRKNGPRLFLKNFDGKIDLVIQAARKYKKVIFNLEDDFSRAIVNLNNTITESIDADSIISWYSDEDKKVVKRDRLGSLKVLEMYIKKYLKVQENIILPLFVLYDLRIWSSHIRGEGKFNNALSNLGVKDKKDYNKIYNSILDGIESFLEELELVVQK